jgi:hypothetical protein
VSWREIVRNSGMARALIFKLFITLIVLMIVITLLGRNPWLQNKIDRVLAPAAAEYKAIR